MFNEQLACKMFLCVVRVSNDQNHQDAIGKVNGSRNLFPTAKIICIDTYICIVLLGVIRYFISNEILTITIFGFHSSEPCQNLLLDIRIEISMLVIQQI